ncbi:hypothetical protein R50073_28580 [Maricurvus nonylphenolicus]|uniref:hypothetical protein n=1 Tax=Maricurvus nonylphenolicus TaxID=1008307 RepID=UPI0036F20DAD
MSAKVSAWALGVYFFLGIVTLGHAATGPDDASLQPLVFGCVSPQYQADTVFIGNILRPALAEKGYSLRFETVRDDSAFERMAKGELAGDCGRIADIDKRKKIDLVQVKPAFRRAVFALWGTNATSLQVLPLAEVRVGYVDGVLYAPILAQQMGFSRTRGYLSLDQAVKALERGELDAILTYEAQVKGYSQRSGYELRRLRHVVTFPVYVYLSPHFRELTPVISEAISGYIESHPYNPFPEEALPVLKNRLIVFGCPLPARSPAFIEMEQSFRRAFNALGYEFKLFALPRAREEVELLRGNLDGTCGRGNNPPYSNHPDLLRLTTPTAHTSYEVISPQARRMIRDVNELETGSRIAYVRGTSLAKQMLENPRKFDVIDVTSAELGVKMLAAGRIDYFVDIPVNIRFLLSAFEINKTLYTVSELPKLSYYPYLRRRHSALIGPLNNYFEDLLEREGGRAIVDAEKFRD